VSRATPVILSDDERRALEGKVRAPSTEQREAFRARILLAAADGQPSVAIAKREGVRPATVSKWRQRFAKLGLAGLSDAERSGPPVRYDEAVERRVLAKLDETPPDGYASWNGRTLAKALADVPSHQVWRILRRHGIHLQRRRSWCLSTDPAFAAKAADVVGIYLNPPENAIVLCVDEKPHIQALERAQGYLRLPNGQAVRGVSHEYKRHGTSTLFAALNVLTGNVHHKHTNRRRREEFLDFMNEVVAAYPGMRLEVILDNLSTHKPKHDRWLAAHPHVRFHFTPTHASWLNLAEVFFSILGRGALAGASFTSATQLREAMDRFIQAYNERAVPFHWTKADVKSVHPEQSLADLRK
jgi:transposase